MRQFRLFITTAIFGSVRVLCVFAGFHFCLQLTADDFIFFNCYACHGEATKTQAPY